MNKQIISKLKMQKPRFFDSTDDRIAVISHPTLEQFARRRYWEGFRSGFTWPSLVSAVALFLALITAQGFRDLFGLSANTWEAIFTLLALALGLVAVFFLLSLIGEALKRHRADKSLDGSSEAADVFFSEDKELKIRKNSF